MILGHGSKVKVNFGTLCIGPCGHDTDYSFRPITFRLHIQVVDDERRNPIDFGSCLMGSYDRSSSTLPPCEGMPHFGLSSYSFSMTILFVIIAETVICGHLEQIDAD